MPNKRTNWAVTLCAEERGVEGGGAWLKTEKYQAYFSRSDACELFYAQLGFLLLGREQKEQLKGQTNTTIAIG